MLRDAPPIFRFAPSPNGELHLGHAYSALINQKHARVAGGRFLLRVEDIDQTRCKPELEAQMLDDLTWLGIEWDEQPLRQSTRFSVYQDALDTLRDEGLVYPSFMTRGQIKEFVAEHPNWPRDPDGSPLYPGDERNWTKDQQAAEQENSKSHALRLDMAQALKLVGGDMVWQETGKGPGGESGECLADPAAWGDVVLARSDTPTSYHLSVTIDDAEQAITHVVRGRDLFHSTSVQRLLQTLLGLPVPLYHHHDLMLDDAGRKLSKSAGDTSLRALRQTGLTPHDIKRMVGV